MKDVMFRISSPGGTKIPVGCHTTSIKLSSSECGSSSDCLVLT